MEIVPMTNNKIVLRFYLSFEFIPRCPGRRDPPEADKSTLSAVVAKATMAKSARFDKTSASSVESQRGIQI